MTPGRGGILAGLGLASVLFAVPVAGQLMLNLPLERYTLEPFVYSPPSAEGWRSTEVGANSLGLVFAERSEPGGVNIRADVAIETFAIPEGGFSGSVRELAGLARQQQAAERQAVLVSSSAVATVPGAGVLETYTLVSVAVGNQLHEVFFVMLAPDRSAYLVAKFTTKEPGYKDQLYWAQFYGALSTLRLSG